MGGDEIFDNNYIMNNLGESLNSMTLDEFETFRNIIMHNVFFL